MKKRISFEAVPLLIMAFSVWMAFAASLSVWLYVSELQFLFVFCLIFSIIVSSFQIWAIYRTLLIVNITDRGIEIQFFRKSCFVEFNNIVSITGGKLGYYQLPFSGLIKIDFYQQTIFGKSIKFWPEPDIDISKFFKGYEHKTVSMIKKCLDENN